MSKDCACSMKDGKLFPCVYHCLMLPKRIQDEMKKQELIFGT